MEVQNNDPRSCRKCGCRHSETLSTRLQCGGQRVARRRQCRNCGHRYSTYEVEPGQVVNPVDELEGAMGAAD